MVEMQLGDKALQHWQQFKSQATGLPILGVIDENEEESSGEDEEDEEEKKRGKGQSSTSVATAAGLTKGIYSS
eukprot:8427818-Ditylum_brightwellii.AAC.1